jgi:tetratricopeptide (TPR) repeat protein
VAGELTEVRASHGAYHLSLAERAAPHLRGAGQLPWLARLRADSGSDAAFGFAHDTGDTDTLVRLAAALGYLWTIQGNHGAAARRLRIALEMPGEAPPPARALVAAYYVINTVLSAGQPPAAIDAEKIRPNPDDPASAMVDAMLALMRGETSAGLAATDPWLDHPDAWTRAVLWLMRSWLHGNDGAMDALRRDLTAAVAAFRDSGERWGMSISLTHRAHAQITLGEFDDAIAALAEAIRLLRALDPTDDAIEQRVLLAAARAQAGDRERARAELREIVDPGARVRSARNLVLARISLGDLARLDGDLTDAARHYDAAEADLNRMPVHADLLRAMLQGARGHLAVARDEPEPARWHIAEALALAAAVPDMPVAADIGVAAAALQRAGGDAAGAAEALGAAHALRGSPDAFDPDVVRLVQQLQAALGTRAYQAAYRRGRRHGRASALGHLQALVHPSLEPPPGTGGSAQARRR